MAKTQQNKGISSYWLLAAALLFLSFAIIWWFFFRNNNVEPSAGPGKGAAVAVEVAPATSQNLTETLEIAGQTQASAGVELRSEVTGRVAAIKFKDGAHVKAGDTLVVLDDSVQRATLAQAEANYALAEANVGRYQRLVEVGAASQLQVDQAVAESKLQAANIAMAKANLAKYRIAAPFKGVVGIAQLNPGDYVQPGQLLVALTDNETLKISFKVPESQAASLKVGAPVTITSDNAQTPITLQGQIDALDGRVDPTSRTLEGKVLVDNTEGTLVSGQFVRVRVPVRSVEDAVVVPDSALVPQGNTIFAYVLINGEKGTMASKTTIEVGLRSMDKAQVISGVTVGQQVVTAGQQKLQAPLTAVKIHSTTQVVVPPAAVEELQ